MKKLLNTLVYISLLFSINTYADENYSETVENWKSYTDVANWMKKNWEFDLSQTKEQIKKIKRGGIFASTTKSAQETFDIRNGWCKDATVFIRDTLNEINPEYKARLIFIRNEKGFPHHWATGFYDNGSLYVMDYGASSHWDSMMGTHGPYDSLDEYGEFLSSLGLNNFEFESATWK